MVDVNSAFTIMINSVNVYIDIQRDVYTVTSLIFTFDDHNYVCLLMFPLIFHNFISIINEPLMIFPLYVFNLLTFEDKRFFIGGGGVTAQLSNIHANTYYTKIITRKIDILRSINVYRLIDITTG